MSESEDPGRTRIISSPFVFSKGAAQKAWYPDGLVEEFAVANSVQLKGSVQVRFGEGRFSEVIPPEEVAARLQRI